MKTADVINLHEAKTHFSRLVDRAAAGEEIVIAKAGKPVAKLVPLEAPKQRRRLGLLEHLDLHVPDNFDDPLPDEVLALFEGR